MKTIAICRVSTNKQEIESQIKELKTFILADGVKEKDITWVTGRGVSAVKEDDRFKQNIQEVNRLIESGKYDCVYAWELSRIARRRVTLDLLIENLVKHHVQLKIKTPNLYLLNPDGSVNYGMELSITLFSTLAEQEMKDKKERFRRGKDRLKQEGKYLGGQLQYGYKLDKEKRIIIDEEQAKVIRYTYECYATGEYTIGTLTKHLHELGYNIDSTWAHRVLINENFHNGKYPQIITKQLFEDTKKIREKNRTSAPMTSKHYHFANRLAKCPHCGYGYSTVGDLYKCVNCKDGKLISIKHLDGMLWLIAKTLEYQNLLNDRNTTTKAIAKKKAELEKKINGVGSRTAKTEKARERAKECVVEGIITIEEYKARIAKIDSEAKDIDRQVGEWKKEIKHLEGLEQEGMLSKATNLTDTIANYSEETKRTIVRKWVNKVEIADDGTITTYTALREYRCVFKGKGYAWKWYTTDGKKLVIPHMNREGEGCVETYPDKSKFTPIDAIRTAQWLGGATILI